MIALIRFLFVTFCFALAAAERPQHMLMRVAVGIHENDIDSAIEVSVVWPQATELFTWCTNYFSFRVNKDELTRVGGGGGGKTCDLFVSYYCFTKWAI